MRSIILICVSLTLMIRCRIDSNPISKGIKLSLNSYIRSGLIDKQQKLNDLEEGMIKIYKDNDGIQSKDNRFKDHISNLLDASSLGLKQFGNGGREDLSSCLESVMDAGGMKTGYSCVDASGRTISGVRSLFRLVLEQYVGIFSTVFIQEFLSTVLDGPLAKGWVPSDERVLIDEIHESLLSVSASTDGDSVTGVEEIQECFEKSLKTGNLVIECIKPDEDGFKTMMNVGKSMIEQLIGVLTPRIVQELIQIFDRTNLIDDNDNGLTKIFENSIQSVIGSASPSEVTVIENFLNCVRFENQLDCLLSNQIGPISPIQAELNTIMEQFIGYIPTSVAMEVKRSIWDMKITKNSMWTNRLRKALDQISNTYSNLNMLSCYETLTNCLINGLIKNQECLKTSIIQNCQTQATSSDNLLRSAT